MAEEGSGMASARAPKALPTTSVRKAPHSVQGKTQAERASAKGKEEGRGSALCSLSRVRLTFVLRYPPA